MHRIWKYFYANRDHYQPQKNLMIGRWQGITSEQGNGVRQVAAYSEQIHHSEYDIESLDNGDYALIKDARKLIVNPVDVEDINIIQFRSWVKNWLLTISIENIEK